MEINSSLRKTRYTQSPSKTITKYISQTKSNNLILNLLSEKTLINYTRNLNIVKNSGLVFQGGKLKLVNNVNNIYNINNNRPNILNTDCSEKNFVECLNIKQIKKDDLSLFDNFNLSKKLPQFKKHQVTKSDPLLKKPCDVTINNTRNKNVGIITDHKSNLSSDSNAFEINKKEFNSIIKEKKHENFSSLVKDGKALMENKLLQKISQEVSENNQVIDTRRNFISSPFTNYNNQLNFNDEDEYLQTNIGTINIPNFHHIYNTQNIETMQSLKSFKLISSRRSSETAINKNKRSKFILINKNTFNSLIQGREKYSNRTDITNGLILKKKFNSQKSSIDFSIKIKSDDNKNFSNKKDGNNNNFKYFKDYKNYNTCTYLTDATDMIENPLLKKENIHKEFKKLKSELRTHSSKMKTIVDNLKRTQHNNDEYLKSYGSILKVSKLKTQNKERHIPQFN
jgi:hypothetical protein